MKGQAVQPLLSTVSLQRDLLPRLEKARARLVRSGTLTVLTTLRAVVQNAKAVGPSQIEPSFGKTFVACYRPPFGVHVWCPDFLTPYIVQVPKMVCFFEAAFENDLRFPLQPFIKSIL